MTKNASIPVQLLDVIGSDGHQWQLQAVVPANPRVCVLWLPALGVAARHYLPLAQALAARGAAVFLHEWRGHGSSNLRAAHDCDWGYRELLEVDLPASEAALANCLPVTLVRALGGHSLGGQMASCRVALHPEVAREVWLVGSGAPWWRAFRFPARWWLVIACRFLPWLARINGRLPGRRIGFGGREASGLIADWAATARNGRYAAGGLDIDVEAALANATPAIRAVLLADDRYAPASSLDWLLGKMPRASVSRTILDAETLGIVADHFQWMQRPDAVAEALMAQDPTPASTGCDEAAIRDAADGSTDTTTGCLR